MNKRCIGECKKLLSLDHFGMDNSRPDRKASKCRACENKYKRDQFEKRQAAKRKPDKDELRNGEFGSKQKSYVGWNSDAEIYCG